MSRYLALKLITPGAHTMPPPPLKDEEPAVSSRLPHTALTARSQLERDCLSPQLANSRRDLGANWPARPAAPTGSGGPTQAYTRRNRGRESERGSLA